MVGAKRSPRHAAVEAIETGGAHGGELIRCRLVRDHDRDRGELGAVLIGEARDRRLQRRVEGGHGRIVDLGRLVLKIVHE